MAWAEDPPSHPPPAHQYRGRAGRRGSELQVHSNFIVYRSRSETDQDFYVGARRDVLRWVDGAWKIARRRLILDQNVLLAKNVSIFF
jgi:3-phenylpropionate/cinnamic acid dioxygenase small subunit